MLTLSFGPMPSLPELTDGGFADLTGDVERTDGVRLAERTDGSVERTDGGFVEHTDGVGIFLLGQGGSAPPQRPPVLAFDLPAGCR